MPKDLTNPPSVPRESAVLETSTVDHGHEHPRVPVTPPFLLAYDPKRWTFLGGHVVPQLITVPLSTGCNHATKDRRGRFDLNKLKSKLEDEERTLIPWHKGPGGKSYVDRVKTRTRAKDVVDTYVSVFCDVHAGDDRLYPRTDEYVAWILGLMEDGTLPKPAGQVVSGILEDRRRKLAHARVRAERQPSALRFERVESLEAEVEALQKLAKQGPSTPKVEKDTATIELADDFDLAEDFDVEDDG